jgi:hypothetical protein
VLQGDATGPDDANPALFARLVEEAGEFHYALARQGEPLRRRNSSDIGPAGLNNVLCGPVAPPTEIAELAG